MLNSLGAETEIYLSVATQNHCALGTAQQEHNQYLSMGRKEEQKREKYSPKRTQVAAKGHLCKTPGKRANLPPQLQKNKPNLSEGHVCHTGPGAAWGSAKTEQEGSP